MDKDSLNEMKNVLAHAQEGNWLPLAIVAGCFALVIVLLIYIYNLHLKNNEARHSKNEEAISEISKNNILLDKIVEKHELLIDNNKEGIKELKAG